MYGFILLTPTVVLIVMENNELRYIRTRRLMATLLDEVLEEQRFQSFAYRTHYPFYLLIHTEENLTSREIEYSRHPNTHVDFVIYNKLDKLPIMAIEVDGYEFHERNERQIERDSLKNSILQKVELPLLRFSTISSEPRPRLQAALSECLTNVQH